MYQILDTLVPWWHLAQVTSKGESHLLGVHSGSCNNFGSPHVSIATKVKLFNTTCVTILLYGCESWVISQDMENKINAFATSCYRVMLNIKHIDHVLNTTVYSMTNTVPLIHLVRHRQLKFLGHILRMSKEEPARRYALYIPIIGKRRPGRPHASYLNYVQRLFGYNEGAMQEQQIATFADDRHAWKNLVVVCSAADGWWWWWWSHMSVTTIHKKYYFSSRWRRKQAKLAHFHAGLQLPLKITVKLPNLRPAVMYYIRKAN